MRNTKHRYYGPDEEDVMAKKKVSEVVKEVKEKKTKGKKYVAPEIEVITNPEEQKKVAKLLSSETGKLEKNEEQPVALTEKKEEKPKFKLYGRSIIDGVVTENYGKDFDTYQIATQSPMYAGGIVDSRLNKIKLEKCQVSSTFIGELINLYRYIKFDSNEAFLMHEGTHYKVNVKVLTFMKALLVNHMNANMEYSSVLADVYNCILDTIIAGEDFCLPLPLSYESPLSKVIKEEIDEFFKTVLTEGGVSYSEVIDTVKPTKKRKTAKKSGFDDAMQVMEMK